MAAVCVYCGSRLGENSAYIDAARSIGRLLAERGDTLVYGGGHVGLMGEAADAALAAGGSVVGIIPQDILDKEVGHGGVTELVVVSSMHERKMQMASRSDAFVALPGGIGTLEEIIEVFTWYQLGFHDKPCALLNTEGYYDPLLALLDHMVQEGFLSLAHRQQLLLESTPADVLNALAQHAGAMSKDWQARS